MPPKRAPGDKEVRRWAMREVLKATFPGSPPRPALPPGHPERVIYYECDVCGRAPITAWHFKSQKDVHVDVCYPCMKSGRGDAHKPLMFVGWATRERDSDNKHMNTLLTSSDEENGEDALTPSERRQRSEDIKTIDPATEPPSTTESTTVGAVTTPSGADPDKDTDNARVASGLTPGLGAGGGPEDGKGGDAAAAAADPPPPPPAAAAAPPRKVLPGLSQDPQVVERRRRIRAEITDMLGGRPMPAETQASRNRKGGKAKASTPEEEQEEAEEEVHRLRAYVLQWLVQAQPKKVHVTMMRLAELPLEDAIACFACPEEYSCTHFGLAVTGRFNHLCILHTVHKVMQVAADPACPRYSTVGIVARNFANVQCAGLYSAAVASSSGSDILPAFFRMMKEIFDLIHSGAFDDTNGLATLEPRVLHETVEAVLANAHQTSSLFQKAVKSDIMTIVGIMLKARLADRPSAVQLFSLFEEDYVPATVGKVADLLSRQGAGDFGPIFRSSLALLRRHLQHLAACGPKLWGNLPKLVNCDHKSTRAAVVSAFAKLVNQQYGASTTHTDATSDRSRTALRDVAELFVGGTHGDLAFLRRHWGRTDLACPTSTAGGKPVPRRVELPLLLRSVQHGATPWNDLPLTELAAFATNDQLLRSMLQAGTLAMERVFGPADDATDATAELEALCECIQGILTTCEELPWEGQIWPSLCRLVCQLLHLQPAVTPEEGFPKGTKRERRVPTTAYATFLDTTSALLLKTAQRSHNTDWSVFDRAKELGGAGDRLFSTATRCDIFADALIRFWCVALRSPPFWTDCDIITAIVGLASRRATRDRTWRMLRESLKSTPRVHTMMLRTQQAPASDRATFLPGLLLVLGTSFNPLEKDYYLVGRAMDDSGCQDGIAVGAGLLCLGQQMGAFLEAVRGLSPCEAFEIYSTQWFTDLVRDLSSVADSDEIAAARVSLVAAAVYPCFVSRPVSFQAVFGSALHDGPLVRGILTPRGVSNSLPRSLTVLSGALRMMGSGLLLLPAATKEGLFQSLLIDYNSHAATSETSALALDALSRLLTHRFPPSVEFHQHCNIRHNLYPVRWLSRLYPAMMNSADILFRLIGSPSAPATPLSTAELVTVGAVARILTAFAIARGTRTSISIGELSRPSAIRLATCLSTIAVDVLAPLCRKLGESGLAEAVTDELRWDALEAVFGAVTSTAQALPFDFEGFEPILSLVCEKAAPTAFYAARSEELVVAASDVMTQLKHWRSEVSSVTLPALVSAIRAYPNNIQLFSIATTLAAHDCDWPEFVTLRAVLAARSLPNFSNHNLWIDATSVALLPQLVGRPSANGQGAASVSKHDDVYRCIDDIIFVSSVPRSVREDIFAMWGKMPFTAATRTLVTSIAVSVLRVSPAWCRAVLGVIAAAIGESVETRLFFATQRVKAMLKSIRTFNGFAHVLLQALTGVNFPAAFGDGYDEETSTYEDDVQPVEFARSPQQLHAKLSGLPSELRNEITRPDTHAKLRQRGWSAICTGLTTRDPDPPMYPGVSAAEAFELNNMMLDPPLMREMGLHVADLDTWAALNRTPAASLPERAARVAAGQQHSPSRGLSSSSPSGASGGRVIRAARTVLVRGPVTMSLIAGRKASKGT
jgi:hypothetical protein